MGSTGAAAIGANGISAKSTVDAAGETVLRMPMITF
jgi:hypothetical protein